MRFFFFLTTKDTDVLGSETFGKGLYELRFEGFVQGY